jgi:hypothetical protein
VKCVRAGLEREEAAMAGRSDDGAPCVERLIADRTLLRLGTQTIYLQHQRRNTQALRYTSAHSGAEHSTAPTRSPCKNQDRYHISCTGGYQ